MATPTCPKCPGTKFEYQDLQLWNGPATKAVVCEQCGAVLGVFDHDIALICKKLEI